MKSIRFLILVIVLSLGTASSCYISQGFPSEWSRPAIKRGSGICDVSGTFSAVGLSASKERITFMNLIPDLKESLGKHQPLPEEILSIEQSTGAITISISEGNASLWSQQYLTEHRDYICTDKGVKVVIGGWDDSGPGGAEGVEWRLYLKIAADGSLLVKRKKDVRGVGMFIPYAYGYSKWYRFERKPGA
jgi:hypothetical protein